MAFYRNLHKSSLGERCDIRLINHKVGFAFLFGYSNLRSTNIPLLVMSRLDNIETHTGLKEQVQVPHRRSEMKGKRRTDDQESVPPEDPFTQQRSSHAVLDTLLKVDTVTPSAGAVHFPKDTKAQRPDRIHLCGPPLHAPPSNALGSTPDNSPSAFD
ncbi:hypothetical protein DPX16_2736 [Anabarilius grahami]|uniref:Uncharacterized protein n=1 Tax=Anabarilius grahami TaxID=495550 RepID=A0A3N0XGP0_ANAGA|nr:hypothetical protein DPX16_2736 [Anabarilius grahami]